MIFLICSKINLFFVTGHGGMEILQKEVSSEFANIIAYQCKTFVKSCPTCYLKKKSTRKNVVVKPIVSNNFNTRCQVDFIDFQSQSDGKFEWVLKYQDHLTKFTFIRPLQTKSMDEIARTVLEIFSDPPQVGVARYFGWKISPLDGATSGEIHFLCFTDKRLEILRKVIAQTPHKLG